MGKLGKKAYWLVELIGLAWQAFGAKELLLEVLVVDKLDWK
jgi:hypothetical protein